MYETKTYARCVAACLHGSLWLPFTVCLTAGPHFFFLAGKSGLILAENCGIGLAKNLFCAPPLASFPFVKPWKFRHQSVGLQLNGFTKGKQPFVKPWNEFSFYQFPNFMDFF